MDTSLVAERASLIKLSYLLTNFVNSLSGWKSKVCKTTVWDSDDSNETGMGSVLLRDIVHLGFFGAAAEFPLGFAFRSMLDWISWRVSLVPSFCKDYFLHCQ